MFLGQCIQEISMFKFQQWYEVSLQTCPGQYDPFYIFSKSGTLLGGYLASKVIAKSKDEVITFLM